MYRKRPFGENSIAVGHQKAESFNSGTISCSNKSNSPEHLSNEKMFTLSVLANADAKSEPSGEKRVLIASPFTLLPPPYWLNVAAKPSNPL